MTNLEIIAFEIKQQFALCQNISEYNNLDNYPIKKLFYLHIKINISDDVGGMGGVPCLAAIGGMVDVLTPLSCTTEHHHPSVLQFDGPRLL